MGLMLERVFKLVDAKMQRISVSNKRPSIIVINEDIFRQLQQDIVTQSMEQKHGALRSPFDLQVYKNCKVITSQVIETVEVL